MPREPLGVRVQPSYKRAVENQAKELFRSEGFIVETALYEMLKHKIGLQNKPGLKMDNDDE